MKFMIIFIFLISANSIYASEYKYLGEYEGADAYLFNYFGKNQRFISCYLTIKQRKMVIILTFFICYQCQIG